MYVCMHACAMADGTWLECADYNPWTGNGPEDILSEQTIKSGFLNKPAITNETNVGRPVIWGCIKSKAGLQTLSSLFVAILEKRQQAGRLTSASTFKPPPRVSLTNTKREAWLSDLANPSVGLRRFNRTIPYGINGKGLLEQCLAKEIPTARAVWLVKCIGANELRTLKRKGVGGASSGISAELKWVREWTMHVEQFVDATVSARSDQTWRGKVQYVVRLTYHLFAEQLLDQDHFLDWILASFEGSTTERMPLWLVHLQLYWRFLVSTRKRGRRLAEAVCNSLYTIEQDKQNADLLMPITQRLQLLLGTLAASHTACLILPKSWAKFEGTIRSLASSRETLAPAISSIIERNNRLAKPLWDQKPSASASPRRRAFELLDCTDLDVAVPDLCATLYTLLSSSAENVIKLVLEWSASPYRQGAHRIYLASRILRRFALSGADIESHVLQFLMEPSPSSSIQVSNIVKVVAELVRAKSFAVLKVLRAVIARGAMSDQEHDPLVAGRLRMLVRGIPTAGLPQHVGDLQQNLLREARSPPSHSNPALAQPVLMFKHLIDRSVFGDGEVHWTQEEEKLLASLTVAHKFEISAHVRQEVLKLSKAAYGTVGQSRGDEVKPLTPRIFAAARDVLEKVEDYPLLADIVGVCLRQSNGEMLASVVNTIHAHIRTFASIGALRPLTTQAIERYHVFRNELPLERVYVKALLSLLTATNADRLLIQKLTYDLTRCDQRSALAMCSPASDNALDIAATSNLDTEEEIERVLTSGTTMDEQSITRIFNRITNQLTVQIEQFGKTQVKAEWFARLRAFDEATFDGLMAETAAQVLRTATSQVCCSVLSLWVRSGALSLASLASIEANVRSEKELSIAMRCKLSVVMLNLLLFPAEKTDSKNLDEDYRFRLAQADFAREHIDVTLGYLGLALGGVDNESMLPDMETLRGLLRSDTARILILRCAIEHKKELQHHVMLPLINGQDNNATGITALRSTIEGMLDQQGLLPADLSSQEKIPRLVRMVNELSLPLCQLEMRLLLLNTGKDKSAEGSGSVEMATSLFEAIMRSPDSERPPWLDLVDGLDAALLHRLRAIAEMQILKIVNEAAVHTKSDAVGIETAQMARLRSLLRRLLYVVDCTVISHATTSPAQASTTSIPQATPGDVETHAVDRFSAVREVLARHFMPEQEPKLLNRSTADLTCILLNSLLHLLIIRKLASEGTKTITTSDISSTLPVLLAILPSPALAISRATAEFLYDTAATLSDDLTDEARAALLRSEIAKTNSGYASLDKRIAFILGSAAQNPDAWLGLVASAHPPQQPATTTSPAAMAPVLTPQQAQARFGTPRPFPQQQGQRPPLPGLQRTGSGLVPSAANAGKTFNAPVPFHLRRWELLPETGSSGGMANDTAIGLGLVGARRV